MVSLRRRRLLGLHCGHNFKPIELVQLQLSDGKNDFKKPTLDVNFSKSLDSDPLQSLDLLLRKKVDDSELAAGSTKLSGSSPWKEEHPPYPLGHDTKQRKRHRRRHFEDQEAYAMRGVYYKNMKWQAAIKVDKKQIHLGTVGTREEAAHLYDRAAFMCGREPNFELPEDEKEELRQYTWVEFLTKTRSAITNKKQRRRISVSPQQVAETPEQSSDPASSELSAYEDLS